MAEGRSARGIAGAGARSASGTGALARLHGIEPPDCPIARNEFFARLLPNLDAAWSTATGENLGGATSTWLLGLRQGGEHAAERCLYPGRGPRRYVGFRAVALHIEVDLAVPESQVDFALARAAEAAPGAMSPVGAESLTCAPMFCRYQDLMSVPLSAVHTALVTAAADANPVVALRRMPFQAQPAVARCSPVYLRFLVGVAVSDEGGDGALEELHWSALEEVVKAVLGARLRVPVTVGTVCGGSLYGAAHQGLRRYQAARLGRIVAGIKAQGGVSALLEVRGAYPQQRLRLTLKRGRECLGACMLQMPLDESTEQMHARIAAWLRGRGIEVTPSVTRGGANDASCGPILALPV